MSRAWRVRLATPADADLLASFECATTASNWDLEVQEFIRRDLLRWAFDPLAREGDPRLLLMLTNADGQLVGVGAHERVLLVDSSSGETLPATKIEVMALAAQWQGRNFPADDDSAHVVKASDVLMSALMADVVDRVPPRDARVLAVIHRENRRSLALCRRYGMTEELSRPHPAYRRLVTPSRVG